MAQFSVEIIRLSGSLLSANQQPPGCNGLELAYEVHNRWPKVLLVITSGRVEPTRDEIADHGTFIRKPYHADDLLAQIDEVIKKADKAE